MFVASCIWCERVRIFRWTFSRGIHILMTSSLTSTLSLSFSRICFFFLFLSFFSAVQSGHMPFQCLHIKQSIYTIYTIKSTVMAMTSFKNSVCCWYGFCRRFVCSICDVTSHIWSPFSCWLRPATTRFSAFLIQCLPSCHLCIVCDE